MLSAMFVYDFLHLPVPFEVLKQRLVEGQQEWLRPLAVSAYREGEEAVIALGLEPHGNGVSRHVRVEVDRPIERDDVLAIPIRWRATSAARLFPVMDGHLEAARFGTAHTHLSLLGRYQPPGGPVGRLLDEIVLHHVAEASVRTFLHQIADMLVETAGSAVGPGPGAVAE